MTYDLIVVGGSFAGIAAALQVARTRRQVLVIDAGMPRNRFAHAAHGFLGQDGRPPRAIIADAREQLLAYPTVRYVQGIATEAARSERGFEVALDSGERYAGARLVLATGVVDMIPDLPGFRERWGVSLLHCPYCHGYELPQGPLGVLEPATSAEISAMSLNHVTLIAEWGPVTFFANGVPIDAASRASLAARGVRIETAPVAGLVGEAPRLSGVALADGQVIPAIGLFARFRTAMASPLAEQLGCALDEGHSGPFIRTDAMRQTTVPGVYAAGDAAMEMHNATLAAAAGAMAGVAAHKSLVFDEL